MKPTASQAALLHTVESAAASAILTIGAAIYQEVTTHGINIPGLLTVLGIAFLGAMSMVYKSMMADPNFQQAENDTANEVKDFIGNEFAQFVGGHLNGLSQQVKALEATVANHSHAPLAAPSAPSQVPQLAFPVPGTAATGGNVVQLTNGGVPFSGATVTNVPVQPQAPMLGTIPTLQAVSRG